MSDAIGALRARVTLQEPVRVADEIGGAAIPGPRAATCGPRLKRAAPARAAAFDTRRLRRPTA